MARKRMRLKSLRPYLAVCGGYVLYLTTLPIATKWLIPCLSYKPGTSYTYAECNTLLILDRFLTLALAGSAVAVLFVYVTRLRRKLLPFAGFALVIAAVTVSAYYLYLPVAMAGAANAPILLESLR